MTHPADFRSLCAELVKALEEKWDSPRPNRLLMDRAHAALAAPQQGAPSDEDWDALVERLWDQYETAGYQGERFMYCSDFGTACDLLRKELASYGAQAVPVADAVAAERARWFKAVEWALGTGDSDFTPPDAPHGRYWWRKELAERCGIQWDGAKWVDAEALPLPKPTHD